MPNDIFRYALELFRNDGTSAGQYPVEVDWEPIRQWVRFVALRRDEQGENDTKACPVRPQWDDELGKPYVSGFHPVNMVASAAGDQQVVPAAFLRYRAMSLANQLIDDGVLERGAYLFRILAYPMSEPEPVRFLMDIKSTDTTPKLAAGNLAELHLRATPCGDLAENELPVFVPQQVLDECRLATTAAGGQETGGILIGGLSRDATNGEVYLQASAQIAAQHTVAGETSLGFTPETWTQVRGAIDLRRRGEIMLGWWHSHPIKSWCAKCPPEKRKKCPLLLDYFSAEDRLLHRTVFPAAYSVALVVNELADDKQTISMFGWKQGMVVQRGFQVLDSTGPAEADRESSHNQEEVR